MTENECESGHSRALGGMSLQARVADRTAHLLVLADEMLGEFDRNKDEDLVWAEESVRRIFNELDSMLRRLSE